MRLCRECLDGDPDRAAELALRAIDQGRVEQQDWIVAEAQLLLAQSRHASGHEPIQLIEPLNEAIERLTAVDNIRGLCEARLMLARVYFEQCVLDAAIDQSQEALDLAVRIGDHRLEAQAALSLAVAMADGSSSSACLIARRHFEQAVDHFLVLGDTTGALRAICNLALAVLKSGDAREAYRLAQRADALDPTSHPSLAIHALLTRAVAAARMRWPGVAERELARAESIASGTSLSASHQVSLMFARGSVLVAAERFADARRELSTAATRAIQLDDMLQAAECFEQLSLAAERDGDYVSSLAAARAHFSAFSRARAQERERRMQAMEVASRVSDQVRKAEALAASQLELESVVDQARSALSKAEQNLEWERSRRALVELRAHRSGAGTATVSGLPDVVNLADSMTELLETCENVAVVVVTVDDDRVVAPMPEVRRRLVQEIAARTHAFVQKYPTALAGALGGDDTVVMMAMSNGFDELMSSLAALHGSLSQPVDLLETRRQRVGAAGCRTDPGAWAATEHSAVTRPARGAGSPNP